MGCTGVMCIPTYIYSNLSDGCMVKKILIMAMKNHFNSGIVFPIFFYLMENLPRLPRLPRFETHKSYIKYKF